MILALALTALLVAMQAYDAYTTYVVLGRGGKELNPVVRLMIGYFGPGLGLAIAKSWAIWILGAGWWFDIWANTPGTVILAALAAWYAWVLEGNIEAMKG